MTEEKKGPEMKGHKATMITVDEALQNTGDETMSDERLESDLVDYLERCQSRGGGGEEYKLIMRAYELVRGLRLEATADPTDSVTAQTVPGAAEYLAKHRRRDRVCELGDRILQAVVELRAEIGTWGQNSRKAGVILDALQSCANEMRR